MLHFSHLIFSANQMAGLWNATLDWNELMEILITPAKVCYLPLSILNILIHHRSGVYFYAIITEKKYKIISNIWEHQLKILPCFCRNTRRVPRQLLSTTKYRSCIRTRKNNQGVPFISILKNIQQTTCSKSLIKAVIQYLNFTLLRNEDVITFSMKSLLYLLIEYGSILYIILMSILLNLKRLLFSKELESICSKLRPKTTNYCNQ